MLLTLLRSNTCSVDLLDLTNFVSLLAGFEDDPQAVLRVMRNYIRHFFGCQACAQHFEEMAGESLELVKNSDEAILWLWEKHNVVNARLAGMGSSAFQKLCVAPRLCHGISFFSVREGRLAYNTLN